MWQQRSGAKRKPQDQTGHADCHGVQPPDQTRAIAPCTSIYADHGRPFEDLKEILEDMSGSICYAKSII